MLHYFGSAVIIQNLHFPEAKTVTPQMDYKNLKAADLLPDTNDVSDLVADYAYMMMNVAKKHIAYFQCLNGLTPNHLTDEHSEQFKSKTVVVPSQVLAKNE
jgi:hypothetical protein